jgi:hypothetical protein
LWYHVGVQKVLDFRASGVAQVVEVLRLTPSTAKEKKMFWMLGQVQQLPSIIPATQEAEIRRMVVQSQPRQKVIQMPA